MRYNLDISSSFLNLVIGAKLNIYRLFYPRIIGAKRRILLFKDFLPEQKLVIKPNQKQKSYFKTEILSPEIIQEIKKWVVRRHHDHGAKKAESEQNFYQLSQRVEELSEDNKRLLSKVDSLRETLETFLDRTSPN